VEGGRRRRRGFDLGAEADRIFGSEQEAGDDLAFEIFPEEPPAARAGAEAERRGLRGETATRVLWAVPWVVFAIAIIVAGGWVFALAMVGLGLIGLREYFLMVRRSRPLPAAGYLTVTAMILAARQFDSAFNVLLAASAGFAVMFLFALDRKRRRGVTISFGITLLGIFWIGIPLVHAVLLRDLPQHGAALLINVLVGSFATDTAAYASGRLFGTHHITPHLSPNKTLEGVIGGVIGGTLAFWFAGLYQDWLPGLDALAMGACIALLAPLGDLFESMIKRDLEVKDTGSIFGPHGGLLDRLDGVLFTIVAGYYLSVAFVY
jgi:phosphatidate cytidylyltransferase